MADDPLLFAIDPWEGSLFKPRAVLDLSPRRLELELSLLYCKRVAEFSRERPCLGVKEPLGLTSRVPFESLPFEVNENVDEPRLITSPVLPSVAALGAGGCLGLTVPVSGFEGTPPRGLTVAEAPKPAPPCTGFTILLGVFRREGPPGI